MTVYTHNAFGYSNGCRCDVCRRASTEWHREYMHRTGRAVPRAEWDAKVRAEAEARDNHGTETRYRFGCRCVACRTAASEGRRARRSKMTEAQKERVRARDLQRRRASRAA